MHYIVEEDKEKKEYIVPVKNKSGGLHYLIQRIAEIPEGEEVVLECKRNGAKNYIEVIPVNAVSAVEMDEEDENDIPTIRNNGSTKRLRFRSKHDPGHFS